MKTGLKNFEFLFNHPLLETEGTMIHLGTIKSHTFKFKKGSSFMELIIPYRLGKLIWRFGSKNNVLFASTDRSIAWLPEYFSEIVKEAEVSLEKRDRVRKLFKKGECEV